MSFLQNILKVDAIIFSLYEAVSFSVSKKGPFSKVSSSTRPINSKPEELLVSLSFSGMAFFEILPYFTAFGLSDFCFLSAASL